MTTVETVHANQRNMQPDGTGPIDVPASGEAGSGAPPFLLSVEIEEEVFDSLRAEHVRLCGNPGRINFNQFVDLTVRIGLERLSQRPAAELLTLAEELEA